MAKSSRHGDPHRWPGQEGPSTLQAVFTILLIVAFGLLIVVMLTNGG